MITASLIALLLASPSTQLQAAELPVPPPNQQQPAASSERLVVLPKGTLVRLMVTKEVNSRDNHEGDRFALRVDEDVQVHGTTIVPTGAKAWGELTHVDPTREGGRSGKLSARLLYVETGGRRIDLQGDRQSSGGNGTSNVVTGVIAFGLFGLLAKGGNASLKAGEILNGYTVSDESFPNPLAHQ